MARTAITPQALVTDGITPTFAAANADGSSLDASGRYIVEVKNASGSSINVTIPSTKEYDGLDVEDLVVAVAATTGHKVIPLFNRRRYEQSTGLVHIDFSAVSSVTIAVFEL